MPHPLHFTQTFPADLLEPAPDDYAPSTEALLAALWLVEWSLGDLVAEDVRDLAHVIDRAKAAVRV